MFATFNRSLEIAKSTFRVMKKDPEMILFPALGAVFSVAYAMVLLVPSIFIDIGNEAVGGVTFGALEYLMIFLTYFGLAFIGTFFMTCVVYTAKTRFEGSDATFTDAIKFALSRLLQIVAWSAVSASVGLLLSWLDNAANRAGGIAGVVLRGLRGAIGFAWSVVTLFVVPAMVYEGVGPIQALKRSAETLKQTWGESLVRHFGFGFISFLVSLPAWALILACPVGFSVHLALGFLMLGGGIVYLIIVAMFFNVANAVFNTALFHYARSGESSDFDPALLRDAIGH